MSLVETATLSGPLDVFKKVVLEQLVTELGRLADQFGKSLNARLKTAKVNDTFGPLVVLQHDIDKQLITFQLRGTYPVLGQSAFVRTRFRVHDQVSFKKGVEIDGFEVLSFMTEIKIKKAPLYECALGYGFDLGPPSYSVGRGMIDLSGIRFDIFLGGMSDQGFALALSLGASRNEKANKFPIIIPLGATGLGITGIGGSFAHNFEPILKTDALVQPEHPTARDYVTWARRANGDELDVWQPASSKGQYRGGLGINCDLVTLDGFLVRLQGVGFSCLSFGPVVIFGGTGVLLRSNICKVDATGAIDFGLGTIDIAAGASIQIPPDGEWRIIEAAGAMEIFLSVSNPNQSFFNLGTDKAPIHGAFLTDIAQAAVYFMLNTNRVQTGGHLRFAFHLSLGPFKVEVYFAVGGSQYLGWNPVQIGGSFDIAGGLKACAFGLCLGIELAGGIALAVPKPVLFALTVTLRLGLPWPLPELTWSGKIFDFSSGDAPKLDSPLLLGFGTTSVNTPGAPPISPMTANSFGAVHARTGRQWKLDDAAPAEIWPDSDLVVPFSRRVTDATKTVMGPAVAPGSEGGFTVIHELKRIQVIQIVKKADGTILSEKPLTGLRALWVAGPEGNISRLHIPSEDPFEWLVPFPTTERVSRISLPATIEQDFGGGPPEYSISDRSFGFVSIRATHAVDLVYLPTGVRHKRFLAGADFTIELAVPMPKTTLFVKQLVLTVATAEVGTLTYLKLEPGFIADPLVRVRPFDAELWLCECAIRRTDNQPFSAVDLSTTIRQECPGEGLMEQRGPCFRKPLVYSLKFVLDTPPESKWAERVVFKPGIYRCEIEGQSSANGYNKTTSISWPPYISREFHVRYPEQLRPYVQYATFGDARLFRLTQTSWNPTPFGRGFPAYLQDLATVRFNAAYISKIFDQLDVEITYADHSSDRVVGIPKGNVDGQNSLSENGLAWRKEYSGATDPDEELQLNAPWKSGFGHLRISYRDNTQTPAKDVLLDEWNCEISRFDSIQKHLEIKTPTITTFYTAKGPSRGTTYAWPTGSLPTIPPVAPTTAPTEWPLPKALAELVGDGIGVDSSLRFLRFAQRLGTRFAAADQNALVGLIEPYRNMASVIEAPVDQIDRPYALLIRTAEPVDWRRISMEATIYMVGLLPSGQFAFIDSPPIKLKLRILPSCDGTQAFAIAYVDDFAVRWPRGVYELQITYRRKMRDMPTITSKLGESADIAIKQQVLYPSGLDWPTQ